MYWNRSRRALPGIAGLILCWAVCGSAQQPGSITQHHGLQAPRTGEDPEGDAAREAIMKKAERLRNEERQKRLVSDTALLLALATELKADMDKSNKNTLSMDVIKKAEEIEKLAKSVKERMRTP